MMSRVAATVDPEGRVTWGKSRDSGNLAGAQIKQEELWVSFNWTVHTFYNFPFFRLNISFWLSSSLLKSQCSVFTSFFLPFTFLPLPKRTGEHKFSPYLLMSHMHTHHPTSKKKIPCMIPSVLTATLCPLGFTEDLTVNLFCDNTEESGCFSKASCFPFFLFLVWVGNAA